MAMSSLEPYGQRTGASRDATSGDDDERWHVRLTDDDVKLMTLEQLDDAYRLSIVDSETAVWKPGMREWQPLRIIAGIEPDDDDGAVEVDIEPEITRVGPTPYDVTPHAPIKRALLPAPPSPPRRSSPPAARSTPPPPRLVSTHRPAPAPAPVARSVAPAPRSVAPLAVVRAPSAPAPVYAQPRADVAWNQLSIPPVALSMPPAAAYPQQSSGGFGRMLLAVAFLAGSAVSLYRNDVLLNWARAGHIENQFLSAEQRLLGGPAFGTVRAVATSATLWEPTPPSALVAPVIVPEPPKTLPEAAPAATSLSALPPAPTGANPPEEPKASARPATKVEAAPKLSAEPAKPAVAVQSKPSALPSHPTKVAPKNTPPARTTTKASTGSPAATLVRLDEEPQSDPQPSKKKAIAVPDAPAPSGGSAKNTLDDAIRSAAARKSPKKKKSGASEYDPLNPDL